MEKIRIKSNTYLRYLTLKRHFKFVWNCANGQTQVARVYGKLTKKDYYRFHRINWGKQKS